MLPLKITGYILLIFFIVSGILFAFNGFKLIKLLKSKENSLVQEVENDLLKPINSMFVLIILIAIFGITSTILIKL